MSTVFSLHSAPLRSLYSTKRSRLASKCTRRHQFSTLHQLLARKDGELGCDILPRLGAVDERADGRNDLVLLGADLLGAVAFPERDGAVLDRLEVDRDAKGRAELVVSAVPLANARR